MKARLGNKLAILLLAMLIGSGSLSGLLMAGGDKAHAATTPIWQEIGNGVSSGNAAYTSLYVDNGTPYVAYSDYDHDLGGKATVMKYVGVDGTHPTGWETAGSAGFSTGQANSLSLYVDNGTPYVAYRDFESGGKATVMKYIGVDGAHPTGWVSVGSPGFSAGEADYTSLYVDHGTPYVAFDEYVYPSHRATVMKYVGVEGAHPMGWETVGNAGFSAGTAIYTSLYIDNGTPYVTYTDFENSYKATVMKFDGTNWVSVGNAGFSAAEAGYTSLYVDNGTPYVAYTDYGSSGKATLMKYGESGWETVGNAGFSASKAEYTSLYIDNGTPYLAYADGEGISAKATVMKYVGADTAHPTGWETVGNAKFSAGAASYTSLYVDHGTPFVAYTDNGNNGKATAAKFVTATVPPALTEDLSDNDTNHAIDIGFADDGTWSEAVTTVLNGTTTLTQGTDYTIDAGKITFNAGVLPLGSNRITVKATGYAPASVVQEVGETLADLTGKGTSADPYLIATADQLAAAGHYLEASRHFRLAADIDLSGYASGSGWQPIGVDYNTPFQGNVDGNGYKIKGLKINRPDEDHVGLFGFLGSNAVVANMKLENVNVVGNNDVGGLVGYNSGAISSSYVAGSVTGGGYSSVGGLVGGNEGSIKGSYAAGSVTGSDGSVGGLVGYHMGSIGSSYATGSVTGSDGAVGGLVGYSEGAINNSYAAGNTTGSGDVGGLVGYVDGGAIDNSFYDKETTGQSDTGKGVGLTTVQMKLPDTYADPSWDFASTWAIHPLHNDGYPYLRAIHKYVTYDGNGNATGSEPVDNRAYSQGESVAVFGNAGNLAKPGYAFEGWNTAADGSGTSYAEGSSLPMGSSDVTLYAQWLADVVYTVTYDGNGATAGSVPIDSGSYAQGATVPVSGNTGHLQKTGSTFAGWNTAANGSGADYAAGSTIPMGSSNITLYAKWTATDTGPGPTPGTGGPSSTNTSNPVISTDGRLTLPVGKSGKVSLNDEVVIEIPVDAFVKDLLVTVEKVAKTQDLIASQDTLASSVFEILKNVPENFLKDITLTFTFNPKSLKNGQKPAVFYYDELKKVWVRIGGEVKGTTITVKVNHFTKYAVFGEGQDPDSAEGPTTEFSDISGHWAEAGIKQAVSAGIVNGYPDGTFRPGQTVTRAEFAVMLMNALKLQADGASLTFADTSEIGAWARTAVSQAVSAGVINGYADRTFRPNAQISRTEMAVMIARALGQSLESATATGFADDQDIPAWAKGAVASMKGLGIIQGNGENEFAPGDKATRAEAVTILLKALANQNK